MTIGIDARSVCYPQRGMPTYVFELCIHLLERYPLQQFVLFINTHDEVNESPCSYNQRTARLRQFSNVRIVDISINYQFVFEQLALPFYSLKYKLSLLHMTCNRIVFFCPTRQIATIHDVKEYTAVRQGALWPPPRTSLKYRFYCFRKRMYIKNTYKRLESCAAALITVSNFSCSQIRRVLGYSRPVSVIYHGLSSSFCSAAAKAVPLEERKYVLMLGGESEAKNNHRTLECYVSLPSEIRSRFPLKVVGFANTGSRFSRELQNTATSSANVSIEGWVSDTQLVSLFQYARAFLFLSLSEGFGFPLIQAMSCGTPALHSDIAVFKEISTVAELKVPPADNEIIINRLCTLLTNDSFWRQCANAFCLDAHRFSWAVSAENHYQAYQQVLSQ